MYAIVQIGGHQYRLGIGDKVVVDQLAQKPGETLSVPAILVADNSDVKLGADAQKTEVKLKVMEHGQGEKLHVRRFRNKSRYRKHVGFRAQLSEVMVEAIGDVKQTAVKQPTSPKKPPTAKKTIKKQTKAHIGA